MTDYDLERYRVMIDLPIGLLAKDLLTVLNCDSVRHVVCLNCGTDYWE